MNAYTSARDFKVAHRPAGPVAHLALGVGLAGAAVALAFLASREPKPDVFDIDYNAEHAEAIEGAKRPETRARRVAKAVEMLEGKG